MEAISITTDIRQGNSLSPVLFNLIMDEIINNVKEVTTGYTTENKRI